MHRRHFIASLSGAALVAAGCSTTSPDKAASSTTLSDGAAPNRADVIDADVQDALARLADQVPSSRELVRQANGLLVFPSVRTAGFVIGGSYGEGALIVNEEVADYYKVTSGSVGLLAGLQSRALYLLFLTPESLTRFRDTRGWAIGADATVALLGAGASASVTSKTAQQPVVGYGLTNSGIMVDVGLEGTKFTELDLSST